MGVVGALVGYSRQAEEQSSGGRVGVRGGREEGDDVGEPAAGKPKEGWDGKPRQSCWFGLVLQQDQRTHGHFPPVTKKECVVFTFSSIYQERKRRSLIYCHLQNTADLFQFPII